ncbi:hypothetical protein PAMP_021809 [Pampus punctatissimus]
MQSAAGKVTRPSSATAPPPPGRAGRKQPHAIGSEGRPSAAAPGQYGFRHGAEVTGAACVNLQLGEGLP